MGILPNVNNEFWDQDINSLGKSANESLNCSPLACICLLALLTQDKNHVVPEPWGFKALTSWRVLASEAPFPSLCNLGDWGEWWSESTQPRGHTTDHATVLSPDNGLTRR